ncbi:ubiquitin-conjugating enzyme E2 14 isoform X2 [Eucalyptus grandis]|uniref:ubiquitin-conjugating enzyme E2 14 isoform X2 n=1 Tax=Eucalyptus grandis TaxID=71139 RepID=UPI00192EBDE2|nr:ubiquitin-conjugating enzyme E2 14 isoform X2 [Eucalyptus grandis]
MASNQASLLLQKQLRDLCRNPVDGFSAGLVDETNVFEWSVSVIGPPDTLYEGGFFSAIMSFPPNYPVSPPTVRFTSEMWHPNVYPDGKVCISILHPPGDDPNGYELASERWSPVHTGLSHPWQSVFCEDGCHSELFCGCFANMLKKSTEEHKTL